MKKILNVLICVIIIFTGLNVLNVNAEVMGGGTTNPVTRDEVEIGTITGFELEDGNFGTTIYYLKLKTDNGREYTYPLADKTYLNYELMKAEDVYEALQTEYPRIAYVVRSEKIKYINPYVINYEDEGKININKGNSEEITVEVFGTGDSTEVKWTSDSKIIFEFIEIAGEYCETVKIKGRIVGKATLKAELYIDGEVKDSVEIEVNVIGSVVSAGTNKPVSPDEILSGSITGFEIEDGDFGDDIYYLKLKNENGEEKIALAKNVIFNQGVYTASDAMWILQNSDSNITYVLRSGKIQYVNPSMPEGLFESAEIEDCYSVDGTTYGYISFEDLVGECVCVVALYTKNDSLCSLTSFDVSYKDAYSYDFEVATNGGEYIKVLFLESVQSVKPLAVSLTFQIDIVR